MKRYPPAFPKPAAATLDYHDPRPARAPGVYRRPRSMLSIVILVVGGLALLAAVLYGIAVLVYIFVYGNVSPG